MCVCITALCYVWQYALYGMSRGILLHVFTWVLQYTTAHLQFLFSLQHLGRITKDSQYKS